MRVVKVDDESRDEVKRIYVKRLSILQAIILDMDREERDVGARPRASRNSGELLAFCAAKAEGGNALSIDEDNAK